MSTYTIRVQEPFSSFVGTVSINRVSEWFGNKEEIIKNKAKEIFSGAVVLDIYILNKEK